MPPRARHLLRLGPVLVLALGFAACGRSGLEVEERDWIEGQPPGEDAGLAGAPGVPDAQPQICVPTEETCNGVDDDCDGLTDELAPVACPAGGEQYCVGGAWSACPQKCEVCMPGSERVCFNSYCKFWGVQTCTADGKSFGKCKEHDPPPECKSIAKEKKYSPELEQCCIDNGYCCRDTFDLDDDGDSGEMLGQCEDVLCVP